MEIQNLTRTKLHPGERLDDLQTKGYEIIQNPDFFCFGMDAVLLCDFARIQDGDRVIDLGTGNGVIPLLLAARNEKSYYIGLEIQQEVTDMAIRSVRHNHLEQRISIVSGDIKEAGRTFGAASFRVVITNPPYMIDSHGKKSKNEARDIARRESRCTLRDIVKTAACLLEEGGRFFMVHRPFRIPEIMTTMTEYKIEPKRMRLVYPYVDREPNMVLIEGRRGGRPRLAMEPPLIICHETGEYTEEVKRLYGGTAWGGTQ